MDNEVVAGAAMVEKIEQVMEHAEAHCRSNGSRLTKKRKQVLLALLASGRALSAYELVDYCKREFGENIQAMSVYRILTFLQEEQLVHKLNLANKYVACSHISCGHAHEVPQFLICGQCQQVKEVVIGKSTLKELQQNVEASGFHLTSPQVEMNCLCQQCFTQVA